MRFDVITLFPELFAPHLGHGVTRRAFESGAGRGAALAAARLRRRRTTGASTTGPTAAGPGMVMLAEPLQRAPGGGPRRPRRCRAGAAGALLARPAGRSTRRVVGEFAAGRGRGPALRPLRRRRPALHRPPRRPRAEPRRLRAVGRRDCRRWPCSTRSRACSPACSATRARTSRTASPPTACSTARTTAGPSCWRGRRGAAVPPVLLSGHHAAIARWRREQAPGAHRRAPARPDRRGPGRRAGSSAADEPLSLEQAGKAIIIGFSDPLPRPRAASSAPTPHLQRARARSPGETRGPDPDPRAGRNRPPRQDRFPRSPPATPSSSASTSSKARASACRPTKAW